MKKSAKVPHYFGLDCGMLEFFKSSKQLLTLPHLELRLAEKIAACVHPTRLPKK
jgi:hypothetical protein